VIKQKRDINKKSNNDNNEKPINDNNLTNINVGKIMTKIDLIGERLYNKLLFSKDNPMIVNEIVKVINGYRFIDTGKSIPLNDKNLILENIGNHIINENDELLKNKLKILLQEIKDNINLVCV